MTTNERGELLCEDCAGEAPESVPCPGCDGRGVRLCEAAGCEKAATVEGADALFVYCSPRCAFDDDNWGACLKCQAEPQDPMFGPFCGATCEAAMLGEIQRRQLARWRAGLAMQTDDETSAAESGVQGV